MNKIVKGDSFLIEHYDIKNPINFKWVDAGNVIAKEVINNRVYSIESLVEQGFWMSDYINLDSFGNHIKSLVRYKTEGENGLSWQDACLITNLLNICFLDILPDGYFYKIPTEMQYILFLNQQKQNGIIINEVMWFRDYYELYPNVRKSNWAGNFIKSNSKTCYLPYESMPKKRNYLRSDWIEEGLGFRIALCDTSFKYSSPKIIKNKWGEIEIESLEEFKDVKIFPSGARHWNWVETGTRHESGIQKNDVIELIAQDSEIVVLSTGYKEMLKVSKECIQYLESKNIPYHILRTDFAVKKYNELVEKGIRVGALIHSTG